MRAILDSGPLIAAWNPRDEHHVWALDLFQRFQGPFYVSEPVLTEVAHLTGRDLEIIAGLKQRRFLLEQRMSEQLDAIEFSLKNWDTCDLADAAVLALSEAYPRIPVLTTDRRHFSAYRRRNGSALPLVLPALRSRL